MLHPNCESLFTVHKSLEHLLETSDIFAAAAVAGRTPIFVGNALTHNVWKHLDLQEVSPTPAASLIQPVGLRWRCTLAMSPQWESDPV